jgi:broad specificity phosphatase PhoE
MQEATTPKTEYFAQPPPDDSQVTTDTPPQPVKKQDGSPPQLPYTKIKVVDKSSLCEINPGVWDGLSPDDVRERYPEEWENFLKDPYGHRAPRAESYHDVCVRLEPILIELEHVQDDLLIITHASVIRCLLAYLVGLPVHEVPAVDIARGDLIEVQPSAYGVKTRLFHFWSGPGRKNGEMAMPSSPPRSNLHLEAVRRSSGIWTSPEHSVHEEQKRRDKVQKLEEEEEEDVSIGSTASNVLPIAEVSLEKGKGGGDEHDDRPTFYENVVENTANTAKSQKKKPATKGGVSAPLPVA